MDNTRVFTMAFASVYPHYVATAEKKGRTKEEVHAIICWLTGYDEQALPQQIRDKVDLRLSSPGHHEFTPTHPGSPA